jgi:hypothetical protein
VRLIYTLKDHQVFQSPAVLSSELLRRFLVGAQNTRFRAVLSELLFRYLLLLPDKLRRCRSIACLLGAKWKSKMHKQVEEFIGFTKMMREAFTILLRYQMCMTEKGSSGLVVVLILMLLRSQRILSLDGSREAVQSFYTLYIDHYKHST